MKTSTRATQKQHNRSKPAEFAKRAKTFLVNAPRALVEEVTAHPYRTLGFAVAVGFGGGAIVGSRILRSAAASMIGAALIEVVRHYVRSELANERSDRDHVTVVSD